MKTFTTALFMIAICLFLSPVSISGTNYTQGSGTITINQPGTHKISGSGSDEIHIDNNTDNAVYNITLSNMTLTAGTWSSAMSITNNKSTPMTVYFWLEGTNSIQGGNHPAIYGFSNVINVIFTTATSGSVWCNAGYSGTPNAFQNASYLVPSVASGINCVAKLANVTKTTTDALSGAFTQKPLELSLTNLTTKVEPNTENGIQIIQSMGNIELRGLNRLATYKIYNVTGKIIRQSVANNGAFNLSKGIYFLQSGSTIRKFIVE